VFLLAQRTTWTVCWTAAIGIVWSRWPIRILLKTDKRNNVKNTCHSHSLREYYVAFQKLQQRQIYFSIDYKECMSNAMI
jgi:hypothetical protein